MAENDFKDYTLSSVAISEGQIFLRTRGSLWAIGKRRRKEGRGDGAAVGPVSASRRRTGTAMTSSHAAITCDMGAMTPRSLIVLACAQSRGAEVAQQAPVQDETKRDWHKAGHSRFGGAYDEGPREKPDRIDGIGKVHFQITTKVPEVQEWFDQGIALLHSFWYYEAERTFRWIVKLDPDAAMGYWGLALAASGDREQELHQGSLEAEGQRDAARARLHRRVGLLLWHGR